MSEISEKLSASGIAFRQSGTQLITFCPFCGKSDHLYINSGSGAWDCKVCGETGGFGRLFTALTGSEIKQASPSRDKTRLPGSSDIDGYMHKLLGQNGQDAIRYLEGRGISIEAIHHFKLGLRVKDGKQWLCIPYFKDDKPVNVKYRSLPPAAKTFERWEGGESILYNQDALKDLHPETPVYITEGEIDCITLWQQGFMNCVSTSTGASSFQPHWVDLLEKFEKVYLIYDSDKTGQEGAKKHSKRFDPSRVYNVVLPEKDSNEFFCKGHSADELRNILEKARPFDIENILTMEKAFERLIQETNEKTESKIVPQWESVRRLTGAYEPGDLVILTAPPKIGKTTFILNDAVQWAENGLSVFFYCLEMRPERILRKSVQIVNRIQEGFLTPGEIGKGFRKMIKWPFYLGYNYKKCNLEIVTETIRLGFRRYAFDVVVFDNLHFLARSITHQVQELGVISKTFKLLAEELQIPIVLIAQPRRGEDEGRVMSINDLKGSSDIGADADQVIVLYRKKKKEKDGKLAEVAFEPETLVRVDASRYKSGGETVLWFDGETGKFTEMSDREEYIE